MNNITQVKRGSTASWSLGPELVHWENLDVWGKDSLIHCEGTDLEMNVYTSSANYFYDENGQLENFKRPGLWLIKKNEISWDISDQAVFKSYVEGPSDCWLEVYSSNIPAIHGQKIPLNAGMVEMTVPYLGDWGIYMRWPEEREAIETARVKISIRVKDAYEELVPGQLGVEYTNDGQVKLKAGMPNEFKWNKLPYIGGGDEVPPGLQKQVDELSDTINDLNNNFNQFQNEAFEAFGFIEENLQSDWNVEDPEAYSYIKNKPFGRVEQTVLFDGDATFSQPNTYGVCYYFFSKPLMLVNGKSYFIKDYGTFPCQNGYINVGSTPISISSEHILIGVASASGMTYHFTIIDPEPSYKTLATEYLPIVHNAEIGNINPISSHGVANIVNAFSAQLGNIDESLDGIIALQKELIGIQLITFTIDGTEYQAKEGMTWSEWVESKYDNDEWKLGNNGDDDYYVIRASDDWYAYDPEQGPVLGSWVIKADYAYGLD